MKGIQTLEELCAGGVLYEMDWVNRAVEELKPQGATASRALAKLIGELLDCRSPKLELILIVAEQLEPIPELVEAVRSVNSARNLAPQPTRSRFTPEIVGGGQVGWTDGTAERIKNDAARVLEKLTGEKPAEKGGDTGRFVDNGDGTVTDKITGLMWQKEDDGTERKYDEALKYCQTLDLAGYNNWRLPRKEELMALARLGYDTLKQDFPSIQAERYWASTTSLELHWAEAPDRIAYTVDFDPESGNYGQGITYFRTYAYFVRAVRAEEPKAPPSKPSVREEIKKPQEKSQKSSWRIAVGAFLTFFGVAGILMMLSGETTDAPMCFCVPTMLLFGIVLLWQGITGKGMPSKSEPARSPSQPEEVGRPGELKPTEQLRILSHRMTQDTKSADVEVAVKNVSSSTLGFAEIEITFDMESDAKGKFTGGCAYQVRDLAPGETRSFRRSTWKYDSSGNPAKVLRYQVKVREMPSRIPSAVPSRAPLQAHKTNSLAIASLVLGIVAIPLGCCYGSGALFGIAAFITGLIGHRQAKESGGAQSGEGMALAGMILGGVSVLLGLALIVLLVLGLLGQGESGF